MRLHLLAAVAGVWLVSAACAHKPAPAPAPAPAPPAAPQNIFALLPEPNGAASAIVVRNQAGSQELVQPKDAVKVARNDTAPSAPYALTDDDIRRLFGSAIDSLPAPEVQFVLQLRTGQRHDERGGDGENARDSEGDPGPPLHFHHGYGPHRHDGRNSALNYALGLRRARAVADILRSQGVKDSDLFVSSHGDADLLVKTGLVTKLMRRIAA